MPAIRDLGTLLATLEPKLEPGRYAFVTLPPGVHLDPSQIVASVREAEGQSVVVLEPVALELGLPVVFTAARVTLTVHSDLAAVGLTAAVSAALAAVGVSCNVVSGVHHDHLFVPVAQSRRALDALRGLQRSAPAAGAPWSRLTADPPTPAHERCGCPGRPAWKLMVTLGPNPLHCVECNGEISPDRLGLPRELADAVASFRDVWGSLLRLWLDSGEYEAWARAELLSPTSAANRSALELVGRISAIHPCDFQWFEDESWDDRASPPRCPRCGRPPSARTSGAFASARCEPCRVLFGGGSA